MQPIASDAPAFYEWDGTTWYFNKRAGYHYNRDGFLLHRALWIDAHGPIPDGYEINHINRKRWDNRLDNLEMLTISDHRKIGIEQRDDREEFLDGAQRCSDGLKRMWKERKPRACICKQCGGGFFSTGMRASLCSDPCRKEFQRLAAASRRDQRRAGRSG